MSGGPARAPRVTKSAPERRDELLEAARRLFVKEGFAEVPVSRIVKAVGVAQGTFYYHFESKEAVVEAMVDAYVSDLVRAASGIAGDGARDPRRALEALVTLELGFDGERARELARIRGADAHTRLFSRATRAMSPIYRLVLERGARAALFRLDRNADLVAEVLVMLVHSLFDRDVFGWSQAEYDRRLLALGELARFLLGLKEGHVDFTAGGVDPG